MEKRVFLAIFLSFVVLSVYQAFFAPKPPEPLPTQTATPTASATPAAPGTTPPAEAPLGTPPAPPLAQPLVADSASRDIVVDTNAVHAVFSSSGAVLKSWKLKAYLDPRPEKKGQPLDLIPEQIPVGLPGAFAMSTDDPARSATLATALFLPSASSLSLGAAPGTLRFEYRDASGLTASKTFHFQPEGKPFLLNVDATLDVNGVSQPVALSSGPSLGLGYQPDGGRESPPAAIQIVNDKAERQASTKLGRLEGAFRFAGVEEQYFLNVAMPGAQGVRVDYQPIVVPVPADPKNRTRNFINYSVRTTGAATMPFFLGPKDLDVLRTVDPQLVRAIDFGIFAWLVVPLLQALKWFNSYLHNYGWAIIALTVVINLLIFPLRHRSMVSMKKMQAVQPEVKAIQERYAKYKVTDPERQKMNSEMMALYKQKGVNPASGCVPMLLTLPVLYAFYNLFYSSIELRGAPFVGWIKDLSLHDPFYITPVVMGATMFWQQRMMPTTADPMQQKIFLLMPLIFTFSFLWAPSGLVLYWLMSNVLAIGQQYLTNRIIAAPVRTVATRKR